MSIDFSVSLRTSSTGIIAEIEPQGNLIDPEFAFYLFNGKERVARKPYSKETTVLFPLDKLPAGNYRVSGFIIEKFSGIKLSKYSKTIKVDPRQLTPPSNSIKRHIRLKEWGVNYDSWKRPATAYLARTEELRDDYYRVRTDANGFIVSGQRWNEQNVAKETWIFLGDSFLECLLLPESRRLSAIIEQELNKQGHRIRCLNGGYSGATTLHLVNVLINKAIPLTPTRIIFFVPTNDARALDLPNGYWRDDKIHSPFAPSSSTPENAPGVMHNEHSLIGLLELVAAACSHWRIQLILATTPHRHLGYSRDEWLQRRFPSEAYFKKIAKKRSAVNSQVRKFASLMSLPLIDIEKMAKDYKKYSYDDLHISENGAPLIANYFLDAIQKLD